MTSSSQLESKLGTELEYVFPSIMLTRCGAGLPQTRTGPGTVVRNADGTLELRMFAAERLSLAEAFRSTSQAGELLPDDAFFSMQATASNGSAWTSERFILNDNTYVGIAGSDVRANLPYLTSSSTPFVATKGHSFELVVHTNATILCNEIEVHNGTSSMSKLSLTLSDDSQIAIFQRKGYLLLVARNELNPVDTTAVSRLLEGLAIASGSQMTISSEITRSDRLETTKLHSLPLAKIGKKMWSPFDGRQACSYIWFVTKYAEVAKSDNCPVYDSWLGIIAAWDQGLMATSLPLSIGVERMLRELFKDRMQEESTIRDAANAMAGHLATAPVGDQMKKRGRGALENIKRKSPSAALKALAAEGWFNVELEEAWRSVRNRSAHGSSIIAGETTAEMQAGLDNLLRCLHLFYALLLVHMRFPLPFVDHSTRGFPDTSFPGHLFVDIAGPAAPSEPASEAA